MANKGYRHLTYEDRCQIYALLKRGLTISQIALELGIHKSTISRELARNRGMRGYRFRKAQELSDARRNRASANNSKMTTEIIAFIEDKLIYEQWSPEQISGRMKREFGFSISHERIYLHVWRDKKRGGKLYMNLRHGGKKYNRRSGQNAGRGCIPGRVDIDERPKVVEKKQRIGDWELDTIIGKDHQGAIVSIVDRASKFTKLARVPNKKSDVVTSAIMDSMAPFKSLLFTFTADNGKEFAGHKEITEKLGAQVYFAKPYHSWERGLNEHTNGLVRQYFPKGMPFASLSQEDVTRVEDLLNSRPRKVLDFQTPLEVLQRSFSGLSSVALRY